MIKISKADLDGVSHLSSREAGKVLGVGKSTVNKYRAALALEPDEPGNDMYSETRDSDGGVSINMRSEATDGPLTLEDAYDVLTSKSVDISSHNVTYGFVERELANGKKVYQYTIRAVPKKGNEAVTDKLDTNELVKAIENFEFIPSDKQYTPETFVITPSDLQVGKTSFHGGTEELIQRVMESFYKAEDFVKEFRPSEIVIADLGDTVENFYSTSSQRETNDLDLTGQIRVARRLLLEGVKILAAHAPTVRYAAVPSNHGSVRVGFKAPAGDNHNDWGLEIAAQLEDAVRENPNLNHVSFHVPEHLYESLTITSSGTKLGFVHGHQARSADKIGEWWKGQDHGRQPTADADILLVGHFHSLRVQHSGNGRWFFVSPASDNGSDWFTNITGEYSDTGMLTFTTSDGEWENLKIM